MKDRYVKFGRLNLDIQGKGDSIWGPSGKKYHVTHGDVSWNIADREKGQQSASINLYGPNTEWCQYTDNGIEKEVKKLLKPVLEQKTGMKVGGINWSEQGMQPSGGWNFDVCLKIGKKR